MASPRESGHPGIRQPLALARALGGALAEGLQRRPPFSPLSDPLLRDVREGDGPRRRPGPLAWLGGARKGGKAGKGGTPPTAGKKNGPPGVKTVSVVTTASIPWLTGTSVNPLLRAAYLAKRGKDVTLVVPWLCPEEQPIIFPKGTTFGTPKDQARSVESWLSRNLDFPAPPSLKLRFYPGRYSHDKHSVLPIGDLTKYTGGADMVLLEEPEHLTWYHSGKRWTDTCRRVVGIVHTNYVEYARREPGGFILAPLLYRVNQWACRSYCHQVIKLSAAVQQLPFQSVCNVNGCSKRFLDVGESWKTRKFTKGAYYLGKMQWGKGHRELVDLLERDEKVGGGGLKCDVFGSGDDAPAIVGHATDLKLPITYHGHLEGQGRYDHADAVMQGYKVFVNPSISDVVCTTTAEALAMGKFVICADHPSNEFFKSRFPNCLTYKSPEEFSQKVRWALGHNPAPLTAGQKYQLSWEAATDRLLDAVDVDAGPGEGRGGGRGLTGALATAHHLMCLSDLLRLGAGAGPVTKRRDKFNLDLEAFVVRENERVYSK